MEQITIEEAIEILKTAPQEYRFALTNPKPWWTTKDLADAMGVTPRQASYWATTIPGSYQAAVGWNIPRTELLVFIAQLYQSRGASGMSGGALAE